MEDSQVDQIFAGDLENLPPFKQPLIRIYMSSTFTDMALEKAALFSEVYPKLKEYCREHYGLEFQVRFILKVFRNKSSILILIYTYVYSKLPHIHLYDTVEER